MGEEMEMWENTHSKKKGHGASPREGLVVDLDSSRTQLYVHGAI